MKRKIMDKFMQEKTWEPSKWDCMQVTNFLMNAAEHLGMNYSQGRYVWTDHDEDDHAKLSACHIVDHLAWLHNWIRPHYPWGHNYPKRKVKS